MNRFIVVSAINPDTSTESETCVSHYLEQVHQQLQELSQLQHSLFKFITTDGSLYQVKRIVPEDGWASLENLREVLVSNEKEKSNEAESDEELLLADCLHDVADSLPYTGVSLRTVLFDNGPDAVSDDDHFIPLAGATRRLVEWHSGDVVLVSKATKLSPPKEVLVDLGQCCVVNSDDELQLNLSCWEGKIAVVDRVEDKGPTFSGHTLNCEHWERMLQLKKQVCVDQLMTPKVVGKSRVKRRRPEIVKQPEVVTQPVCGRTIEVLQEVDLRTFPFFLVDSWTLNLNVREGHTDVLIQYIQELQHVGILARLRVYPDVKAIPCCGDTDVLNTEAWKKSILANISEEPPEEVVTDGVFFLYFLLLPPVSQNSTAAAVAQVVLSPKEISRSVVEAMSRAAFSDRPEPELGPENFNLDARVLQSEGFADLLTHLQEHGDKTAKEITDRTEGLDKDAAEKKEQEILEAASEVRDKILTLAFQDQPTVSEFMQQRSKLPAPTPITWVSEASLDPEKFPEKLALEAESKRIKKTELQSYPSADSMWGSSPITLEELKEKRYTTDFDVNDVLRMFSKDGTPIAPPFTPEKMQGRNLCRVDSTPDLKTPWPNSQSLQYHDIYYYMDENDLGLEKKYSKIRDKVLGQDTLCTFVSPIKKKSQPLSRVSPVRSSPRRRNSAQHLMTRSRSDSVQSDSATPTPGTRDVFKQPSLNLHSSSSRRLSLAMNSPGSIPSSCQSHSSRRHSSSGVGSIRVTPPSSLPHRFSSQPVSHSTPVSALPRRVSPRKKVLSKSFSSACLHTSPAYPYRNDVPHSNQIFHRQHHSSLTSPMLSTGGRISQHSAEQEKSFLFGPPVRRSPRKSAPAATIPLSQYEKEQNRKRRHSELEQARADVKSPSLRSTASTSSSSVMDLDESSQQSQPSSQQQPKLKRSDRHKLRLQNIIKNVLEENGIKETDSIYAACLKNLFNVSMVLLKTLTTSQNLTEEMKTVVYSQVTQIINLEKRRCGISV